MQIIGSDEDDDDVTAAKMAENPVLAASPHQSKTSPFEDILSRCVRIPCAHVDACINEANYSGYQRGAKSFPSATAEQ